MGQVCEKWYCLVERCAANCVRMLCWLVGSNSGQWEVGLVEEIWFLAGGKLVLIECQNTVPKAISRLEIFHNTLQKCLRYSFKNEFRDIYVLIPTHILKLFVVNFLLKSLETFRDIGAVLYGEVFGSVLTFFQFILFKQSSLVVSVPSCGLSGPS